MRKFNILPVTVLFTVYLNAQNVNVTPFFVSYPTLEAAFASINAGIHTGNITIDIVGNTTETFPAFLNASGMGAANYTSVLIRPSGGVPRTISGAMTPGLPVIELNGADNVTIDGLNAGGNSLIIRNTTVSSDLGTSTIRFIDGATNNVITRSTIEGSFSGPVPTAGGVIYFGPDPVTLIGNDNNTITFNDIGPAGANLPSNGVYSYGTTTTTANYNSGIDISFNYFRDVFAAPYISNGVYLYQGSTDINITNNRFFQTALRTFTAGVQHSDIRINNPSDSRFLVTDNIFGAASSSGTGISNFVFVPGSSYVPISLNVGNIIASGVQGNTIANIAMAGAGTGTDANGPFRGISVDDGLVDIGNISGNTIGSQTATNSITYTSSSTSSSEVTGIYNGGVNSVIQVFNNSIGGITAGNSSTGAIILNGIRINNPTATATLTNNIVGGSVPNSLQSTSSSPASRMRALYCNALVATIRRNSIRDFSLLGPGTVTGMECDGAGTYLADRNFIHSFNTGNNGTLNGIVVNAGTGTYRNNMIRLGIDGNGNPITVSVFIHGIQELGGTNKFHFNSIFIGGTGVTGTSNSASFRSTVLGNTREYLNNIFINARSNSTGTGTNWAHIAGGSGPNPPGLTSDYNVLFTPGNGGSTGFFNGSNCPSLDSWRFATGQDNNSVAEDPKFINPTGNSTTVDLHIHPTNPTVVEGTGLLIGTVTDDFDGHPRLEFTPTDIGADAGNFVSNTLPVSLLNFSGYKQETVNILRWTTVNEFNNLGFEVQSSSDGITYSPIGFVNTLAPGGNSNAMLNYMFTDINRSFKQYYRLRQVDVDNRSKFSTIVLIRGEKSLLLAIEDLFPNPANSIVNVIIGSPVRNELNLVVTDMTGRIVIQKTTIVETGSNTIPVDVSKLTKGSYLVKLVCPDCYRDEPGVSKFVKQ